MSAVSLATLCDRCSHRARLHEGQRHCSLCSCAGFAPPGSLHTPAPQAPSTLAAIARPGDAILIGFNRELSDEDVEVLREGFRPMIDQRIEIAFLENVTSMTVVKGEEEE